MAQKAFCGHKSPWAPQIAGSEWIIVGSGLDTSRVMGLGHLPGTKWPLGQGSLKSVISVETYLYLNSFFSRFYKKTGPFYKKTCLELNFSQTKTCIQTTKQIGVIKSVWFLTQKSLDFMKTLFLIKTAAFYKKYPFL